MQHYIIPANRKALIINIDTSLYGSFAEIGGGQEVARHFFQAGGASGTIAKTISAYDKRFSDSFYNNNKQGRHVSEGRLIKMLDYEYKELTSLLSTDLEETTFFALANTMEVLNYSKTNKSHGWMGVKYQLTPNSEPNLVIIHIKLLENDALMQQTTIGLLGVNLLYACKFYYDSPNTFLKSLTDNVSVDRFRITIMRMSGHDLDYVDNKLLAVQLVKNKMTRSIMFDKQGNVQQPSDMLYKKNVLAFRGSFMPVTYIAKDILNKSMALFALDEDYEHDNTLSFCELTINNILSKGEIDEQDFLNRVDMLVSIGQNVMISDLPEYYKLVEFFSQFKMNKLRIVMGIPTFERVLNKKYYKELRGGILEAVGKMFPSNMKLYIYPTRKAGNPDIITSDDIDMDDDVRMLFDYLKENRYILDIKSEMINQLHVSTREVNKMITSGKKNWEKFVPMSVCKIIKDKKLNTITE
ncbi:MAG: TonB-dependent receptor [Bacteroidetes bacterium]|nr:TonB-dependent receptor [Bacteroidota bacterium]